MRARENMLPNTGQSGSDGPSLAVITITYDDAVSEITIDDSLIVRSIAVT